MYYLKHSTITYSEVEQTNSYSSSKKHGKIRGVFEFWLLVWFAELKLWILGHIKHYDKQRPYILRTDVQPRTL